MEVFLLWAQYGDKSGEEFLGVYQAEIDAERQRLLIERCSPGMILKVVALPYISKFAR